MNQNELIEKLNNKMILLKEVWTKRKIQQITTIWRRFRRTRRWRTRRATMLRRRRARSLPASTRRRRRRHRHPSNTKRRWAFTDQCRRTSKWNRIRTTCTAHPRPPLPSDSFIRTLIPSTIRSRNAIGSRTVHRRFVCNFILSSSQNLIRVFNFAIQLENLAWLSMT